VPTKEKSASRSIALAVLTLAVAPLMFAGAARAEFRTIPLKHVSYDELKSKCAASGGQFESVGKTDYWCQTKTSTVVCDTKNCTGGTGSATEMSRFLQQRANPNSATGTLTTE